MRHSSGSKTAIQSLHPRKHKGACDCCRRRKVKCNRGQPCDKCVDNNLQCRYESVKLRKGPKGASARILSSLPSLLPSEHATKNISTPDVLIQIDSVPGNFFEEIGEQRPRRVPSLVLLAYVNVFLEHMYSIMPIFDEDLLRLDCNDPDTLPPVKYALLTSLCAITHIQLKLDRGPFTAFDFMPNSYESGYYTGEFFISECLKTRQEFDFIENPSCATILCSFFLFASYGNLDKQSHAWFYLTQSISFARALCLHSESHYATLECSEAEIQKRIYWLLFVTERGYALQRSKPVTLIPSIRKPSVFGSHNPKLAYGFLNLILLFENVPSHYYDWISNGAYPGPNNESMVKEISNNIAAFVPLFNDFLETQEVDIYVTRDWLQTVLWRHSTNSSNKSCTSAYSPILTGKSILKLIASASQSSMDAHGIGMEQKLFDVGSALVEVSTAARTQSPTSDTRELIWGFIMALSHIRGTTSYLLPALVQCSQEVLGWHSPLSLELPIHKGVVNETQAAEQAWSLVSVNEMGSSSEGYADGSLLI